MSLNEKILDQLDGILLGIIKEIEKMETGGKVTDHSILSLFPLADEGFKSFKVCFSE